MRRRAGGETLNFAGPACAATPGSIVSAWTPAQMARLAGQPWPEVPIIRPEDTAALLPGVDLWDYWPVQLADGRPAPIAGGTLWIFLSADRQEDPDLRHDSARMRLMFESPAGWVDYGPLLPPGYTPGSREWSGSTRFSPDPANPGSGTLTVLFTAAGRRGEAAVSFEQRLFECRGTLQIRPDGLHTGNWSGLREAVISDGKVYFKGEQRLVRPRCIQGFRDPFWFWDPMDGREWLLFTASMAQFAGDYNGAIGLALAREHDDGSGTPYRLHQPVLHACGLVTEMERPHLIIHRGSYYLFWSSSHRAFAPGGPRGPTGLYGMVAPALLGPYQPLNETGLVLGAPASDPDQTYCWQVLPDLQVTSFVDYWGPGGRSRHADPRQRRAFFGGTPAPLLHLQLNGNRTRLMPGK